MKTGRTGDQEQTYLERGIDVTILLDEKAHLPLAVRRSARGKLAGRLVGTHDGSNCSNWRGIGCKGGVAIWC